jgi:anion-transporting  ArsA/GET3 family ATPase
MGKGGVGKTTIAAGLAVLDAETYGRAVLVEFGDGESGRRALGGAHRGVEHLVIKPDEAIHRCATPLFGSSTLTKLALGNFAMKPLLRAAPAIRELAMLESVRQISAERPGVRVVVDMPATGHGVAWLRVPKQGRTLLGSGPLFDLCDRVGRELLAPSRASIVVVTLPERLVIEETLELCALIAQEGALVVDHLVVNRMPQPMPAAALEDATQVASNSGPLALAAAELVEVLTSRATTMHEALAALEALSTRRHVLWRVPLAPIDPTASDVARWLLGEGAA